ncbi:MAG: pimeloyl-ACP methyl ester carboxylesterase [Myxococcota bacterium]|jgi:pimeloyl-ACP methyl ester carboxylesterase
MSTTSTPGTDPSQFRYAYLHGFASSPLSRKAVLLAPVFAEAGVTLVAPDLNIPSFAQLSVTAALAHLDALSADDPRPWRIIGSSLGGWMAARWAELNPTQVDRLLLLCPGFDLTSRWPQVLGAPAIARWRSQGVLTMPAADGTPTPLSWGFIEDCLTHPGQPDVTCPTRIIHGSADEVVPIDGSRAYADPRANVGLIEVDDDHSLMRPETMVRIAAEVRDFFGLKPA